jgi:hypothetical protein
MPSVSIHVRQSDYLGASPELASHLVPPALHVVPLPCVHANEEKPLGHALHQAKILHLGISVSGTMLPRVYTARYTCVNRPPSALGGSLSLKESDFSGQV